MFSISQVDVLEGCLGICPLPGRFSTYLQDLTDIIEWRPSLVVSLLEEIEMPKEFAQKFRGDLNDQHISWRHSPIEDYGVPIEHNDHWQNCIGDIEEKLRNGDKVLCHCFGGCGRSGMLVLRLMCQCGEPAAMALHRLRLVRPCAVETGAQMRWATRFTH